MKKDRVSVAGPPSAGIDGPRDGQPRGQAPMSDWELIVVLDPDAGVRSSPMGITSDRGVDVAPLASLLEAEQIALEPLFGDPQRLPHTLRTPSPFPDDAVGMP